MGQLTLLRRIGAALAVGIVLVLAACGDGADDGGAAWPDVAVLDAESGREREVDLAGYASADRPVLAWFWAPF